MPGTLFAPGQGPRGWQRLPRPPRQGDLDFTVNEGASVTSLPCVLPATMRTGKVLLADVTTAGSVPSLPTTGGWQWHVAPFGDAIPKVQKALGWTVDPNAGLTFTQLAAGRMTVILVVLDFVDTVNPFDVLPQTATAAGAPLTIPQITTGNDGCLLLSGAGVDSASVAALAGPFAEIGQATGTGKRGAVGKQRQATRGPTGSQVWTSPGSSGLTMSGYLTALKPAGSGGVPGGSGTPPARFAPGQGPRAWQRLPRPRQGDTVAAGGQVFTASLGGTIGPSGTLANQTSKPLAGTTSPAGALTRLTGKAVAGTLSPTGALSLVKVVLLALGGSLSPTGALTKLVSKPLAGSTSPTGALTRQDRKALTGATSPTGGLAKLVRKPLAGTISPSGALTLARVVLLTLGGTIGPAGTLARQVAKQLTGATSPAGALTRRTGKALGGSTAPAGSLAKRIGKPLQGLITAAGLLQAVFIPGGTARDLLITISTPIRRWLLDPPAQRWRLSSPLDRWLASSPIVRWRLSSMIGRWRNDPPQKGE